MTCVSARNLFTLCNSIISSDFLYKTLKFSRPFSASAACYLKALTNLTPPRNGFKRLAIPNDTYFTVKTKACNVIISYAVLVAV